MASAETWISSEVEKGILLSETEENGVVTRTYIAPMLEPEKVEMPDPLALPKEPKEYPMPFFCPHCGNGIGSSGAFTMHLRACQRRLAHHKNHKEELPVKFEPPPTTRRHQELEQQSYPDFKHWSKSIFGPFQCIFCNKEFKVQFADGQVRRRYACDDCGQKARAEEAERQKNPKVMRQTLACDRCGKQYKLEGFLVRHQLLCQGFSVKKKREYKIHEVVKKKRDEKDEVAEVQLKGEIKSVSEVKSDHEIHKTTEIHPNGENDEVTKIKPENGGHEDS